MERQDARIRINRESDLAAREHVGCASDEDPAVDRQFESLPLSDVGIALHVEHFPSVVVEDLHILEGRKLAGPEHFLRGLLADLRAVRSDDRG